MGVRNLISQGVTKTLSLLSDQRFGRITQMATLVGPRSIAVSESLCRLEAVSNAVADLRLEGLHPSARVQSLFEEFIAGRLSENELVAAVLS